MDKRIEMTSHREQDLPTLAWNMNTNDDEYGDHQSHPSEHTNRSFTVPRGHVLNPVTGTVEKIMDLEDFSYPPLPVHQDAIRILELEQGEFGSILIGTLKAVKFGERPRYLALSYTWNVAHADSDMNFVQSFFNDPEQDFKATTTMILNGVPVAIQHNLGLALHHLRQEQDAFNIWIDAVCIHQSNYNERSTQVSMMKFIYARAYAVVAWLGLHAPLHLLLRNFKHFMREDLKHSLITISHLMDDPESISTETGSNRDFPLLKWSEESSNRLIESLYWSRIWVIQEVCLAEVVLFAYGPDLFNVHQMREALQFHHNDASVSEQYAEVLRLTNTTRPERKIDKISLPMHNILTTRIKRFTSMTIDALLEKFLNSYCSEVRDYVYGLVGLAYNIKTVSTSHQHEDIINKYLEDVDLNESSLPEPLRGAGTLVIDYQKSYFDIWADMIKMIYFRSKDILKNSNAAIETKSLPIESAHRKKFVELSLSQRLSLIRNAALLQYAFDQRVNTNIDNFTIISEPSIFRAVGFVAGKIEYLGPQYNDFIHSSKTHDDWQHALQDFFAPRYEDRQLERIRKANSTWRRSILSHSDQYLDQLREIWSSQTCAWRNERTKPSQDEILEALRKKHPIPDATKTPLGPKLILGLQHLGLAPSSSQIGDILVNFWGCNCCIVMRPMEDDKGYILIGRAEILQIPKKKDSSTRQSATRTEKRTEKDELKLRWNPKHDMDLLALNVQLGLHMLQTITSAVSLTPNPPSIMGIPYEESVWSMPQDHEEDDHSSDEM